jgi:radical SAM-linked protein
VACDPDAVKDSLDAALPPGLDIVEVVEAAAPALAERIEASHWRIELPDVPSAEARRAAERFLALAEVPVDKVMKDGRRTVDARSPVLSLRVSEAEKSDRSAPCAILELVVRHVTPTVRPDDVLTALRQAAALMTPVTPMVTRLAQGLLGEAPPVETEPIQLRDPLRDVAAPAATR